MKQWKDNVSGVLIIAYLVSVSIVLNVPEKLRISYFLSVPCAFFSIMGGIMGFSLGVQKYRTAREKNPSLRWYDSSSIAVGCAMSTMGLITIETVYEIVCISADAFPPLILIFLRGTGWILFVSLLLYALAQRKKEA